MSNDKTFELPELTYSEREDVLVCLLLVAGKEFTPTKEMTRLTKLYNKIQSHF